MVTENKICNNPVSITILIKAPGKKHMVKTMGTAVRDLNPNVYPPQHFVRVSL